MTSAPPQTTTAGTVTLSTSGDGRVATITLDRPRKLNALSLDMISKLEKQLHAVGESPARVVVLRSAGDRAFCVGADIAEFSSFEPEGMWRRWISEGHRVFNALASLRQPTIAVIDGIAAGGGLELALACDLRVGSTRARLSLPETGIGTVPGWGGSQRLAAVVGVSRAKEIIFTRRQIDAATAHAWGLLNTLVDPADLEPATDALIADILGGAPTAVQVSKQMVDAAACGGPAAIVEALASGFTASTAEFGIGLNAFLTKTTPEFASAYPTRHTD